MLPAGTAGEPCLSGIRAIKHLFRVVTGCGGKPVAHAVSVQYNTI